MPSDAVRLALERVGQLTAEERRQLGASVAAAAAPASPLGLRFGAGAPVRDLVSGQRAIVERGDRDPETKYERYRVRLADARQVYRSEKELEGMPAPAPRVAP